MENYYLRDSRSDVGSCALFWAKRGGYTTNLKNAEIFTRENAIAQYQCRETDIPVRTDIADQESYLAVDMQDVHSFGADKDGKYIAQLKNAYDGNNIKFLSAEKDCTYSFKDALILSSDHTCTSDFVMRPYENFKQIAIPVVNASKLKTTDILKKAKIKIIKPRKSTGYQYRCYGEHCGRFVTQNQYYQGCPNCGWYYCG